MSQWICSSGCQLLISSAPTSSVLDKSNPRLIAEPLMACTREKQTEQRQMNHDEDTVLCSCPNLPTGQPKHSRISNVLCFILQVPFPNMNTSANYAPPTSTSRGKPVFGSGCAGKQPAAASGQKTMLNDSTTLETAILLTSGFRFCSFRP